MANAWLAALEATVLQCSVNLEFDDLTTPISATVATRAIDLPLSLYSWLGWFLPHIKKFKNKNSVRC
jgi:hypothetical protein